jgi:hypothetical protein
MSSTVSPSESTETPSFSSQSQETNIIRSFFKGAFDQVIGDALRQEAETIRKVCQNPLRIIAPVNEFLDSNLGAQIEDTRASFGRIHKNPDGFWTGYTQELYNQWQQSPTSTYIRQLQSNPDVQANAAGRLTAMLLPLAAGKIVKVKTSPDFSKNLDVRSFANSTSSQLAQDPVPTVTLLKQGNRFEPVHFNQAALNLGKKNVL